jgi:hypothetical protein
MTGPQTTIPRDNLTAATLMFPRGLENLHTSAGDTGEHLLIASFVGPQPEIEAIAGAVSVRYPRGMKDASGHLVIAADVRWSIEVKKGISNWNCDLTEIDLAAIRVTGGIRQSTIRLPKPRRQIDVNLDGGMSGLSVIRPTLIGTTLTLKGPAKDLTFDDQRFGALGGDVDLEAKPTDQDSGQYRITVSGGSNQLRVVTE